MLNKILPFVFFLILSGCSINIYTKDGVNENPRIGITNYQNFKFSQDIDTAQKIFFKSFTNYNALEKSVQYAKTSQGDIPKLSGQTAFAISLPNGQNFIIDQANIHNNNIIIKIRSTNITSNVNAALITTPKVKDAKEADLYLDEKLIATVEVKY